YKTGKVWAEEGVVIGGGGTLQAAPYPLALGKPFSPKRGPRGRPYYCTYVGAVTAPPGPLRAPARGGLEGLGQTSSDAVAKGFLPAAPKDDREWTRCDYQPVCGPNEWQRVKRKPADALVPLGKLREMP